MGVHVGIAATRTWRQFVHAVQEGRDRAECGAQIAEHLTDVAWASDDPAMRRCPDCRAKLPA